MQVPLLTLDWDDTLPPAADVVVVGGGIVGVCAAYWLARAGQDVLLLEKGRVGAEQSSRNWGWCRQQNRDARELPVATRSLALWEEMTRDIGEDLGFRRTGLFYLSDKPDELETWAKWIRFAHGEGVDTRLLSSAETKEHGAATGRSWLGGVWAPTDGVADPSRAAPLIAKGVVKHGGRVLQNCAARGLETEAGHVSAVITERGTVRTRQVVLAGGAWSGAFVHQLGIDMPQSSVRQSVATLVTEGHDIPSALHTSDVTVTRRGAASHTVAISGRAKVDPTPATLAHLRHFVPIFARRWNKLSPGDLQAWRYGFGTRALWRMDAPTPMEAVRILNPRPSRSAVAVTLRRARQLIPALRACAVGPSWAGYVDSTPDGVPVIDAGLPVPGLMLAAGFSGHGFGIGPGTGQLIADVLLGRQTILPVAQFSLSRFATAAWGKVADF